MSNITLVRPALVSSARSYSNPVTPPIGLAYLAGTLVKQGIGVKVIDAIGESPDTCRVEDGYLYQGLGIEETTGLVPGDTALIGVSCMFTQDWPYVSRQIRSIRKRFPRTPIIAGGEHVSALPEFSLRDCPELDYCVLGEGEETLAEVASRLKSGQDFSHVDGLVFIREDRVVRNPQRKRIRAVDDIPPPAWDLLPVETYLSSRNAHGVYLGRSLGILATRGCPYECTFCSNPVMYGRSWFARDAEAVLDEIEGYIKKYDVENIDFYDLTMVVKRSWILDFCRGIERRDLHFTWQLPSGTRCEVIDDEVAEALYRTGCRNLTYAPESGSVDTLERIKKKVSLPHLVSSTRSALRRGMHVKCNLIIGFPHETRRHLMDTLLFAWKLAILGVHDIPFYLYSPYPGTELFEEVRAEHFADGLDEGYFRSLVAYMDLSEPSPFCRQVGPGELNLWRLAGMASSYGLSFLIRPARLFRLVANLMNGRSETVLEQRLGARVRRRAKSPALIDS